MFTTPPNNPHFSKAKELENQGNRKEAVLFYDKAIKDVDCPPKLVRDAMLALTIYYTDQGEVDKAEYYINTLETLPLSNYQLGRKYICQYNIASKKGEYDKLPQFLSKAINHCEKHEDCKDLLGLAFLKKSTISSEKERRVLLFKAYDLLQEGDNIEGKIFCMAMLGISYDEDFKKGEAWLDRAWDLASTNPQKYNIWLSRILN